jgi:hypothetical protein
LHLVFDFPFWGKNKIKSRSTAYADINNALHKAWVEKNQETNVCCGLGRASGHL